MEEKKEFSSSFNMTTDRYDGAELCELIGVYIQSSLECAFWKDQIGLYWDDGCIVLHDINNHQPDKILKKIIYIWK